MRILIVDDSEDVRDIIEAQLADAGYKEISTADSAKAAFKVLAIDGPSTEEPAAQDLVLLDVLMPEIDGIEACARIRNNPRYSDLPIIMVTQLHDVDTLANAFIAGATDYITKPVVRVELLARVRSALKLKSELDRRKAREQELLNRISHSGAGRDDLIDDVTGLFVSDVAENYLRSRAQSGGDMAVIALVVDRIAAYRATQGDTVANRIMAQVARAVRTTAANIGVVASTYRNGMIILIAPEYGAKPAKELGEALRASIARLALNNVEAITADHVTASVAVVSAHAGRTDLTQLLIRAISTVKEVAAVGGNRMVTADA